MIVCIEGADCSGKTTLFNAMREDAPMYRFLRFTWFQELAPFMHLCDQWRLEFWEAVYDPGCTYVCDRSLFVSGPVYGELYGRPNELDIFDWVPYIRVLYLCPPLDVLTARHRARGDEHFDCARYERVLELYAKHLAGLECVEMSDPGVKEALGCVREWRKSF